MKFASDIFERHLRVKEKECDSTEYYFQDYKIACANADYETALQFLRTKEYWDRGLFLKDIDVTMDYAGSFDREEVIDYMVTNHDFWCQGAVEKATKTILDNSTPASNLGYLAPHRTIFHGCQIVH